MRLTSWIFQSASNRKIVSHGKSSGEHFANLPGLWAHGVRRGTARRLNTGAVSETPETRELDQ